MARKQPPTTPPTEPEQHDLSGLKTVVKVKSHKLRAVAPDEKPDYCPISKGFMLDDLKESDLTPADIPCAPVVVQEFDDIRYKILYPWDDLPYRYKIHPETSSDGRKYEQPQGSPSLPFARSRDEYEEWCKAKVKWIVEGEKKACAGMKRLGAHMVGVGGCTNALKPGDSRELHPMIKDGAKPGDHFILAFDGDLRGNADVRKGVGSTARLLADRGCTVEVLVFPEGRDGRRQGLDDWLKTVPKGQEARALAALERETWEEMPVMNRHLAKMLGLVTKDKKEDAEGVVIIPNHANAVLIVKHYYGPRMTTDRYAGPSFDGAEMRDYRYGEMCAWIQRYYLPMISLKMVTEAAREVLDKNEVNALGDWLRGLKWDGKKRIATFWQTYCSAPVTKTQTATYLGDVARVLFMGAVQRAQQDNVKWDYLLTLHGRQGVRKTTLWEVLGGSINGRPLTLQARLDKDEELVRMASKCWFLNFDELAGKRKAEQQRLKNWLSQTSDSWVPKYQEHSQTSPRRCLAVATTNERDILSDVTGNRRHLVVDVGVIDIDAVVRDREQLYAEAMLMSTIGEWWAVRDQEVIEETYRARHPWEDVFDDVAGRELPKLDDGRPFITVQAVQHAAGYLRGQDESKDLRTSILIGQLAHSKGWHRLRVRIGKVQLSTLPANNAGVPDTRAWLGYAPDQLPSLVWVLLHPKADGVNPELSERASKAQAKVTRRRERVASRTAKVKRSRP